MIESLELGAQLVGIAGAADDGHAGAGRNAGLAEQSGDDQERSPPGDGSATPHSHMPTPTIFELVLRRFLYRASAHKGKNFR